MIIRSSGLHEIYPYSIQPIQTVYGYVLYYTIRICNILYYKVYVKFTLWTVIFLLLLIPMLEREPLDIYGIHIRGYWKATLRIYLLENYLKLLDPLFERVVERRPSFSTENKSSIFKTHKSFLKTSISSKSSNRRDF